LFEDISLEDTNERSSHTRTPSDFENASQEVHGKSDSMFDSFVDTTQKFGQQFMNNSAAGLMFDVGMEKLYDSAQTRVSVLRGFLI
jgi:hypothetical protein